LEEFDDILSRVIDKTIRDVFGDRNAGIIFDYLEKSGCPMEEIPIKPSQFSVELGKILGSGRGQLLGVASILEETILKAFCAELRMKVDMQGGTCFEDNIKILRRVYEENAGPPHLARLERHTTQC
jgi:hypothetical protein